MKVWTKVVYKWDAAALEYVVNEEESSWMEYDGPVAECKKDSKVPGPDPMIGQAAAENVALGKEWLSFAREQYGVANERQADVDQLTGAVTKQQLADSQAASKRGDEQYQRYQRLFQPVEDRMVQDATSYDSAGRRDIEAAKAKAEVLSSAADAKARGIREMTAMGIDPRSGRFAGIEREADMNTALAAADAQNKARDKVEMTGMALREGVANMGRGATSTAAQQSSLALTGGNSAVGNTMQAEGNLRANTGIMQSGYQGAIGANTGAAGIMNNQYQNQLSGWSADQQAKAANVAGIASAFGTGAGLFLASSKDYKDNKQPVDGALEALDSMPVEEWDYKAGIGDGGHHIGPYAEDFKAATGKGDGRSIPLQDAMGLTMRAVQELNKKVDGMAAKQGA